MRRAVPLADEKLPWLAASAGLLVRRRSAVVPALGLGWTAVAVAALASRGVERLVDRDRPQPTDFGDRVQTGDEPSSSSMPSSRTAGAMAFAFVVGRRAPRTGRFLVALATLVACDRV